jgi:hypothetical protein
MVFLSHIYARFIHVERFIDFRQLLTDLILCILIATRLVCYCDSRFQFLDGLQLLEIYTVISGFNSIIDVRLRFSVLCLPICQSAVHFDGN